MSRAAWLIVALALMPSIVGGIGVQTNDYAQAGEPTRQALERGDYEEAVRQARQLLATVVSQSGPDSLEAARVSDLLVEALLQNGEAADPSTLDVAQRAVAIKRARATERLEIPTSLINLGRVNVERGAFAAALPLHQEAVSIRSQALAPDDPLVADSLDALAHTFIQMDRFDDARPLLVKSLNIREPRADSDANALARTLELQAWLFRYAGDYDRAQAPLERALAIRQRLPPDHPDLASAIQVQGDVLWLRGDIQQARAKWSEGLALVERALRFEHPAMVGFQRRLALSANVLGYRSDSRQLLDDGLRIGVRGLAPCNRELTGLRQYLCEFSRIRRRVRAGAKSLSAGTPDHRKVFRAHAFICRHGHLQPGDSCRPTPGILPRPSGCTSEPFASGRPGSERIIPMSPAVSTRWRKWSPHAVNPHARGLSRARAGDPAPIGRRRQSLGRLDVDQSGAGQRRFR